MQQRMKVDESQDSRIVAQFKRGVTMAALGEEYGVSRERIRQILAKYGVTGKQGGALTRSRARKERLMRQRDKKYIARYGCSYKQFKAICGNFSDGPSSPLHAYRKQSYNAMFRGVEWNLSFWDWWTIWDESGKWDERGRGRGAYCMCRFEDKGAYEVGNVYIGSFVHNSVEGKTLALEEPKVKSPLYAIVHAAGGPMAVAEAVGLPNTYISQIALHNYLPRAWVEDGRAKILADMTCGAYSPEQVARLAIRNESMKEAS